MARAYYNEVDPFCVEWLRRLIAAGHIAPGDVDDRDIRDVRPADLRGYTQCHFFAGIGVWSYALRLAGWPDGRPVWTGSCPCQPFSTAGRGAGFADERHLWPYWHYLIESLRPPRVFGEQVASPAGLAWLDLVQADMEGTHYALGAVDLCAAGVGAPHIRQRLFWMGLADSAGRHSRWFASEIVGYGSSLVPAGGLGLVGDPNKPGSQGWRSEPGQRAGERAVGPAGLVGGPWADADWIYCRDEKWRPIEPGSFPLAHRPPARVGRLRAYGNAIVAEVAAQFIAACMDEAEESHGDANVGISVGMIRRLALISLI